MATVAEVVFLGTGSSSGIPFLSCLSAAAEPCATCSDAVRPGSRNRRGNPSALVRYKPVAPVDAALVGSDGMCTVLVDCGKSFYSSVVESSIALGRPVEPLAGVLLTHGHADALLGLDDLRHYKAMQGVVDVWCDADTLSVAGGSFPYLVDASQVTGGGDVAAVRFTTFEPWTLPEYATHANSRAVPAARRARGVAGKRAAGSDAERCTLTLPGGMRVLPVHVPHGLRADGSVYWACGYLFDGASVVYISDTQELGAESLAAVAGRGGDAGVGLLVVDCCFPSGTYHSHACWPQTRRMVEGLCPRTTVLVGMSHEIEYGAFQRQVSAHFAQCTSCLERCCCGSPVCALPENAASPDGHADGGQCVDAINGTAVANHVAAGRVQGDAMENGSRESVLVPKSVDASRPGRVLVGFDNLVVAFE